MKSVFGRPLGASVLSPAWVVSLAWVALAWATAAHAGAPDTRKRIHRAAAEIVGCAPGSEIRGRAALWERPSSEGVKTVEIRLRVEGLTPGKHAVHLHERGVCRPCSAAKGHFDPGPMGRTNPDGNHPFHSGDLVNIEVDENGRGFLRTHTTRVSLSEGQLSLFDADGSAFIIHVNPDTYCPHGVTSGCAGGARAACGIIHPVDRQRPAADEDD